MSRSKLREKVFQFLFRVEFNSKEELEEQAGWYFADEEQQTLSDKEKKQILDKVLAIVEHLDQIDGAIDEKAKGWDSKRVGKVELAIMRLAIYEMLYDDTIPQSVSINEAVELAKKYAQEGSYGFINGVLANFVTKESEK